MLENRLENILILMSNEICKLLDKGVFRNDILIVISKDILKLFDYPIFKVDKENKPTLLGCNLLVDEYANSTYYSVSEMNSYKL